MASDGGDACPSRVPEVGSAATPAARKKPPVAGLEVAGHFVSNPRDGCVVLLDMEKLGSFVTLYGFTYSTTRQPRNIDPLIMLVWLFWQTIDGASWLTWLLYNLFPPGERLEQVFLRGGSLDFVSRGPDLCMCTCALSWLNLVLKLWNLHDQRRRPWAGKPLKESLALERTKETWAK